MHFFLKKHSVDYVRVRTVLLSSTDNYYLFVRHQNSTTAKLFYSTSKNLVGMVFPTYLYREMDTRSCGKKGPEFNHLFFDAVQRVSR